MEDQPQERLVMFEEDSQQNLYVTPLGMGPFKSIGLMLPEFIWKRPRPLSLQDLKDAGETW